MKEFNIAEGVGEFIIHLNGDNSKYEVIYDHGQIIFQNSGLRYIIPENVGNKVTFLAPDPNTGKRTYIADNVRSLYRDTTPTDFGLGSNLTDVEAGSSHFTEEIVVGGINESILVVAPAGVVIWVNDSVVASGSSVEAGDRVKFEIVASSSYETTTNFNLSVGDITKSFNITTKPNNGNLETGLLSYWPLNGNTLDIIGGRNLTQYGSGVYENIKNGSGFYINSGGYLQANVGSAFHTDEFAISMWVNYLGRFDAITDPIVVNMENDWEMSVDNGTGSYKWAIYGQPANSWTWINTSLANRNNQLTHLVFQYNRDNSRMEVWVNGSYAYGYAFSRTPGSACNAFTIGGRTCTAGAATSSRSNMKVADVAVWNRNLVQADIDLILEKAANGYSTIS